MGCDSVYIGCSDHPEHIFSAAQEFERRLWVEHRNSFDEKSADRGYRTFPYAPLSGLLGPSKLRLSGALAHILSADNANERALRNTEGCRMFR